MSRIVKNKNFFIDKNRVKYFFTFLFKIFKNKKEDSESSSE